MGRGGLRGREGQGDPEKERAGPEPSSEGQRCRTIFARPGDQWSSKSYAEAEDSAAFSTHAHHLDSEWPVMGEAHLSSCAPGSTARTVLDPPVCEAAPGD